MSDNTKRQGDHKASCTKLSNDLQTFLNETLIDANKIEATVNELRCQLQKVTILDDVIQDTITDQNDLKADIITASDFQTKIKTSIITAESTIQKVQSAQLSANPSNLQSTYNANVKLAKLQLPTFDGNPVTWSNFWDIFETSVHNRSDLNSVNKFYLKGQLRGIAYDHVDGFASNNDNYNKAVNLLKSKFGKPHKIVSAHLSSLFDLPSPSGTAQSLNQFRANYESHLRSLKALNKDVDQAGFVFAELLMEKLPNSTRDNLNRSYKKDFWNLKDFREALDKEIKMIEAVNPIHNSKKHFKEISKTSTFSAPNESSASSLPKLTAGTFSTTSNYQIYCKLCETTNDHSTFNCTQYIDGKSRSEKVKQLTA